MTDTSEGVQKKTIRRTRTTIPRVKKKTYPVESLYVVGAAGFLVGALVIWGSLVGVTREVPQLADRLEGVEEAVRQSQQDTEAILSQLSNSNTTQEEREQFFKEQLATLSTNLSEQQSVIEGVANTTDVSRIVEEWNPFVYRMACFFQMPDKEDEREDRGSATVERTSTGVRMLTSKHLVERKGATLVRCTLSRPGSDEEIKVTPDAFVKNSSMDYAYAFFNANETIPAVPLSRRCSSRPNIGDQVLILGYPGIGAKESVTATEGIISGFDSELYTTSAKIEKGNSGGAVVDVVRNCFLGIPTSVLPGNVESLARILPILGL